MASFGASAAPHPFYFPIAPGRRFCLVHSPGEGSALRGTALHVHPFAEELNKCRRMSCRLARELAGKGWAVMQIDLLGCGDSSGDFAEADWVEWLNDICTAYRWLRSKFQGESWLWGTRAGCLLAAEALAGLDDSPNLLFWQPVHSGRQHLTQFLRLRLANEILGSSKQRSGVGALKQKLLLGESLEIAGYALSPKVAVPLDRAHLTIEPAYQGKIVWLEVSPHGDRSLSPASASLLTRLREQGLCVRASAVDGSPFWQTVEVTECPELIAETLRSMDQEVR